MVPRGHAELNLRPTPRTPQAGQHLASRSNKTAQIYQLLRKQFIGPWRRCPADEAHTANGCNAAGMLCYCWYEARGLQDDTELLLWGLPLSVALSGARRHGLLRIGRKGHVEMALTVRHAFDPARF